MGLVEAGDERRRLAEVPAQSNDADVARGAVEPRQSGERPIGRAVVDEDRFSGHVEGLEHRTELVIEQGDAPLLVVHRDDDGDHVGEVIA